MFNNSPALYRNICSTCVQILGYILYKIWNISKNKAPIGKHGYRFGEKACMYHYQKEKLK